MSRVETEVLTDKRVEAPLRALADLVVPVALAAAAVTVVLAAIVVESQSAWTLLGAGRGLVPEDYYPLWGFVLTLATTFGQAVGWAAGSGMAYYVLTRLGMRPPLSWKLAMSLVYVGLGGLPLAVYDGLFGGPLLGLPREGLEQMLQAQYPDAHWLLISLHPLVDGSVAPLAIAFLGLLWFTGERPRESRVVQTLIALALLGTSLAVALSLAIHSTLAHIRL